MQLILQTCNEMARLLQEQDTMLASKHIVNEPPKDLEEDPCKPFMKLKRLVPGASLTEQA